MGINTSEIINNTDYFVYMHNTNMMTLNNLSIKSIITVKTSGSSVVKLCLRKAMNGGIYKSSLVWLLVGARDEYRIWKS